MNRAQPEKKVIGFRLHLDKTYRVLPHEEQIQLVRRAQSGEQEAREKLVLHNLGFITSVARYYLGSGVPIDDMINAGVLGVYKAIEKFDCTLGFRFITYAVWNIKNEILMLIASMSRVTRLPQNVQNHVIRVFRFKQQFLFDHGRDPSSEEIANGVRLKLLSVVTAEKLLQEPVSLDQISRRNDEPLLNSIVADAEGLYETVEKQQLQRYIDQSLWRLDRRERFIIECYFGLNGQEPLNMRQIGEVIDLGHERVRQIRNEAIAKLRKNEQLRDYAPVALTG